MSAMPDTRPLDPRLAPIVEALRAKEPAIELRNELGWGATVFWSGERVGRLEVPFRAQTNFGIKDGRWKLHAHRIPDRPSVFGIRRYTKIESLITGVLEHCRPLSAEERAASERQERMTALNRQLRDRREDSGFEQRRAGPAMAAFIRTLPPQSLPEPLRELVATLDRLDAEIAELERQREAE